jgi:hypothetical protein
MGTIAQAQRGVSAENVFLNLAQELQCNEVLNHITRRDRRSLCMSPETREEHGI